MALLIIHYHKQIYIMYCILPIHMYIYYTYQKYNLNILNDIEIYINNIHHFKYYSYHHTLLIQLLIHHHKFLNIIHFNLIQILNYILNNSFLYNYYIHINIKIYTYNNHHKEVYYHHHIVLLFLLHHHHKKINIIYKCIFYDIHPKYIFLYFYHKDKLQEMILNNML